MEPESGITDLSLGTGFARFEPAKRSKLIPTDKNRLDAATTSSPGMREAVCHKIVGGVPPVHANQVRQLGRDDLDGEGASMGTNRSSGKKNGARNTSFNPELIRTVVCNGASKCNGLAPGSLIPVVADCRLRKVLQMIASDSPQKIQDLALECNLSESHLQHLFKECTGLGLGRMLADQRMQRAANLLEQTNLSIKEIAWTVGYEHTSSFTRAFERHFRESPRCFRQRQESLNARKAAV